MNTLESKKKALRANESSPKVSSAGTTSHPYKMTMRICNKRGVLARITRLVSQRGLSIESLDFGSAGRSGDVSVLDLILNGKRGQLQGFLNDAQKLSEIRDVAVEVV